MKLGLLIGGSIGLVLLVGLAMVWLVRKNPGTADGLVSSRPTDTSKVTYANYTSLKPGLTLPEIENVLGGSESSSLVDLHEETRRAGIEVEDPRSSENGNTSSVLPSLSGWRRWQGKDITVWIAFAQSKDGLRAAYCTALTPFRDHYRKQETAFIVWDPRDFEKLGDDRKQESFIRMSAKWIKGSQARELLLGEWRDKQANGYQFGAGSKLEKLSIFPPVELSYRLKDDSRLEILTPSPFAPIPGHPAPGLAVNTAPTVSQYDFFVNQDELALIDVTQHHVMGLTPLHEQLFRMPVRAGSPGEKEFLNALLEELQGADPNTRNNAFEKLRRIGRGGAVAIPRLLDIMAANDAILTEYAAFIIGDMKEAAKPAFPRLFEFLRSTNVVRAVAATNAFITMGPVVGREALPVLSEVKRTSRNAKIREAADVAILRLTTPSR